MNQIVLSTDVAEGEGPVTREIEQNGQKLWVASLLLGTFSAGNVVLRGYGLTEYNAIEECRDKAVRFGQSISSQLAEGFATRIAFLKDQAMKEMAKQLGLDLNPQAPGPGDAAKDN